MDWLRQSVAHGLWAKRFMLTAVVLCALIGIGLAYSTRPGAHRSVSETP